MFLLATLLVAVLSSFNAQRNQIRKAGLRLEAANVADQLLAEWMSSSKPLPVNQTGAWNDRWSWQTRLARRTAFHSIPINIVTLEIRDSRQSLKDPLVTVEVAEHPLEEIAP
jgi:hypothetical protein